MASMDWIDRMTGLKFKNELRLNGLGSTEVIQLKIFLGFDDTWSTKFGAVLAGIPLIVHTIEI